MHEYKKASSKIIKKFDDDSEFLAIIVYFLAIPLSFIGGIVFGLYLHSKGPEITIKDGRIENVTIEPGQTGTFIDPKTGIEYSVHFQILPKTDSDGKVIIHEVSK